MAVIAFYIDAVYDTSDSQLIIKEQETYSTYYSMDVIDNAILTLNDLPEETKIDIWKSSPIQEEVLESFPNMQRMQEIYEDRLVDNGKFKIAFLYYMKKLHNEYIAGEINADEFKELFLSPSIQTININS